MGDLDSDDEDMDIGEAGGDPRVDDRRFPGAGLVGRVDCDREDTSRL